MSAQPFGATFANPFPERVPSVAALQGIAGQAEAEWFVFFQQLGWSSGDWTDYWLDPGNWRA